MTRLSEFYGLEYQETMDVYPPLWQYLSTTELAPMPGARILLKGFRTHKAPMMLVTSADTDHAEKSIAALDVPWVLECIVHGDMVSRLKPSPEPYLKAAERLSVSPKDVVAFEDSGAGVASVLAAGMFCVAPSTATFTIARRWTKRTSRSGRWRGTSPSYNDRNHEEKADD